MSDRARRVPGGLPTALLLSVEDAAARLGVSDDTVRRLIAGGHLPAVRVPGRTDAPGSLRIRVRDLERWVANLPEVGQ